jgi:hypothetical protein
LLGFRIVKENEDHLLTLRASEEIVWHDVKNYMPGNPFIAQFAMIGPSRGERTPLVSLVKPTIRTRRASLDLQSLRLLILPQPES